jgi:hypothetical protein
LLIKLRLGQRPIRTAWIKSAKQLIGSFEFINYVENVLSRLEREFPGQYSSAKKTIAYNIELMRKQLD